MEQELAYSFHLGSDKNKSKVARKTAKGNISGTTSLSNNAIQNANNLSRVNKHNLRDYDNQSELITTIYGTDNIVNDVKQVETINRLTDTISDKDEIIDNLRADKEELKGQLHKFKEFWRSLLKRFQEMIGFNNDEKYKYVSDDLYRNGIFDDNDNEIANNILRKVTIPDENKNNKLKKKNDFNLN